MSLAVIDPATIGGDLDSFRMVEQARALLARATSIPEVKEIRDKAEAIRLYVKQRGDSLVAQNAAAEIRLRAERRAGELLEESVSPGNPQLSHDERISLSDLGIDHNQSSRWQRIASVPEATFDEFIEGTKGSGDELTTSAVLRIADRLRKDPDAEPEPWTLDDVVDRLARVVKKQFAYCPEPYREVMAHQLIALGNEILENGELGP